MPEALGIHPALPEVYDFSNGASNTYLVETRHRLIPSCLHCARFVPVKLDGNDYHRFFVQNADYIQHIFPYLTGAQRELLLSGIHPECWDLWAGEES